MRSAPPPPPGTSGEMRSAAPPPPGLIAAETAGIHAALEELPEETRIEVEHLRDGVRQGRRRSRWLASGTLIAVALACFCWMAGYAATVLSYAEVGDPLQIDRDPLDEDRLIVAYRPTNTGKIAFRRSDAEGGRATELLGTVTGDEIGQRQELYWRLGDAEPGDVIEVTYLSGWSLATRQLRVPGRLGRVATVAGDSGEVGSTVRLGEAGFSGEIVNALNKQPVGEAEVRILGTPLAARSDGAGRFRIEGIPDGAQRISIAAEGFAGEIFEQELSSGRERSVRVALSPGLEKGQVRIVLTWNEEPSDLDAHLEGPLPNDERFHVYYHQPGDLKSKEYVRLDVDDRGGGGPETITVLGVVPGTYRYFVHDYSNRDKPQSTALARSDAEVKVYHGGQTYRFRAGHDQAGNVWDVCTIEVTPEGAVVRKIDRFEGVQAAAMGLYDKRTMANREQWITAYGGSEASEQSVLEGLDWLARHQLPDGSWSNQCLGPGGKSMCRKGKPCTGTGDRYEMAQTGLALLAFQAGGHYYFNGAKYSETVRKGLDWMVSHQRKDGGLVGTKDRGGYKLYHKHYMYEHGIAAFALADACASSSALDQPAHKPYVEAASRAVRFIEANQKFDGGWRYTPDPDRPGDTSVSGWQILALKSAGEAGIPVDEACLAKAGKFFKYREMGENGRTGYDSRQPQTDATTGLGMIARLFVMNDPEAPLIQEAAEYLADQAVLRWSDSRITPMNTDYYLWYNCTLGMFQAGGQAWERWNGIVRDRIIALQKHGGCERGSWDPDSRWGRWGGRVYTTALAILTLQVYYRYTPHDELGGGGQVDLTTITETTQPEGEVARPDPVWLPARKGDATETPAGH